LRTGDHRVLDGPVGERNVYALHPRGTILAVAATPEGLAAQLSAIAETGNEALVVAAPGLPSTDKTRRIGRIADAAGIAGVLVEGDSARVADVQKEVAALDGPILIVQANDYRREWLIEEVSVSTNTTAAGGNAALMTLDSGDA
jgi:RHH-type proline utilization regulon transcriptional repressor/proline dehydrogenase/delta 1-pyrroline-5-carboxylate dehydrogenase